MKTSRDLLLYGANGYTGRLIAETAAQYGLRPILAGRSEDKIRPLAEQLGYPYRIADLRSPEELDALLEGVKVVLHAAGPFQFTAEPMIEACLRNQVHYLDITGEIAVFEHAASRDAEARLAGIMLLPGAGFDVVPTDCLAVFLKNQMPDATHLELAFSSLGGGSSHGTASTAVLQLGEMSLERKNGKIVEVPLGHKSRTIDFEGKKRFVMSIPWGDVSTAYHSTGIPNVVTYMGIPPKAYQLVKIMPWFNWMLRTSLVKKLAQMYVDRQPAGPDAAQRAEGRSMVWGRVQNASGETRTARLNTPEGYTLTAHSSLIIASKVLAGEAPVGFQTPAKAYGADLVMEVASVQRTA
jgi:short subunit dehydrogenase-like uncharacterized protein